MQADFNNAAPHRPMRCECSLTLHGMVLPVYPLLMAESWKRSPTQACRPLIRGLSIPGVPIVALTHLAPLPGSEMPNRLFIREERIASIGKTIHDFETEAVWNVATRRASWRLFSRDSLNLACCEDDYLAAERILDPQFLLQAHQLLKDEMLFVSVPRRQTLLAISHSAAMTNRDLLAAFNALVNESFRNGAEVGISPLLFLSTKGYVNTVMEVA